MNIPLSIKKLLSPFISWLYAPLHLYEELLPDKSKGLYLAYFGFNKDRARLWAKRALGEHFKESGYKKMWIWQIDSKLKSICPDCQLIMVETSRVNKIFLSSQHGYTMPMWVQFAIDTRKTLDELKSTSFRIKRDIPRLIKKHGLSLETSNEMEDLDNFIDTMHIPYIQGRHTNTAFFSPRQVIQKVFTHSTILFIVHNGMRIAGVLLELQNNTANLRYIGIKNNNPEYLRLGCIGALYFFAIKQAIDQKIECFNFGGSNPFLNDGLSYFKLSFKPYVMKNTYLSEHLIKLIPRGKSQHLSNYFYKNPFIYLDKNSKFVKIVFLKSCDFDKPKEIASFLKAIQCENIYETRLYIDGEIEKVKTFVKECRLDDNRITFHTWN